jgi:hypothetical protein
LEADLIKARASGKYQLTSGYENGGKPRAATTLLGGYLNKKTMQKLPPNLKILPR